MIRKARPTDDGQIREMLQQASLPTEGLEDENLRLFVLEERGRVVGAVGIEYHGPFALMRSLCVAADQRGGGRGRALLFHAIGEARDHRSSAVYGLTTTIPDWLTRLRFKEIAKEQIPTELKASKELQGACPDGARVFTRTLAVGPRRAASAFIESQ